MVDINKIFENNSLPQILLIFGEENYFKEELFHKLINNFINQENSYDCDIIDCKDIDLIKFIDIINSYPFIAENRFVFCKNFESLFSDTKSKKKFENSPFWNFLNNPLSTTKLVILSNNDKLHGISSPKNASKIDKLIENLSFPYNIILKKYDWIEFPRIYENEFPKIIIDECKKNGKKIDVQAIEFLLTQVNADIREILSEIKKIFIYVNENPLITYNDVVSAIGASKQYNVYELQKAVGQRDLNRSLEILINILSYESQETLIVFVLEKYFISLFKLFELYVKEKDKYKLSSELGINQYFLSDYLKSLQLYSINEIEKAIIILSEIELKLKSTSAKALNILEIGLVNIMSK